MQDKIQLIRYAKIDHAPQVEVTTFVREGTNGVSVGDSRLLKIPGVEGNWFWLTSENFLGNPVKYANMDKSKAIDPYSIPLKEGVVVITADEYQVLKAAQKVAIDLQKSDIAAYVKDLEEKDATDKQAVLDKKTEILKKLGLSEEEVALFIA